MSFGILVKTIVKTFKGNPVRDKAHGNVLPRKMFKCEVMSQLFEF